MAEIQTTLSPKIKDGRLTWCEGDVFDLTLCVSLTSLGEAISDLTGYSVEVNFYDAGGAKVHTFTLEGDGTRLFTLSFTASVSAKFPRGAYRFDVAVTDPTGKRSTVADDAPAAVR